MSQHSLHTPLCDRLGIEVPIISAVVTSLRLSSLFSRLSRDVSIARVM